MTWGNDAIPTSGGKPADRSVHVCPPSEELKTRGVEFTEEPEERPYGIDAGFRDPAGNSFRLTQVREDLGI